MFVLFYAHLIMKLNKNNHLGVYVNNIGEAEDYYSSLFGFKLVSRENEKISFKNGDQFFYIIKSKNESGAIIEFEVEDIEKVKLLLQKNGIKILKSDGKGGDCFIKDRYGMIFNLWEK